DGDHFWGNQLIGNVTSITSDAARTEMDLHKPRSMLAFGKLGRVLKRLPVASAKRVGHWFDAMCLPYAFEEVKHSPAGETFSGTVWREIGGRKLQLIEVGPAHTSGDLMVYVPDARTLFAGDILFIGSTPVMWAGPVENWLNALDLILELDVETIVPGHGPITNKDGVRAVKSYWEYVRGAARECHKDRMSAKTAAHHIVSSDEFRAMPQSGWDSPERMMTNVYLLYRQFDGRNGHLSAPAKVNLMRKQALLAHALPNASPKLMRQLDASL
ncbi:MAG: MBL fold metallo-hydrolase, partial [Methyloligellaceae bacterium]